MRLRHDGRIGQALDGETEGGRRPVVHLVLGGHTHVMFPRLGALPPTSDQCIHPTLGDEQLQLIIGPLMQIDLFNKRGEWPFQAQFLRFFCMKADPRLIIVARLLAGRKPGVLRDFEFVEIDPRKRRGVCEERIALSI
jgi:hypothetical protein